MSNTTPIVAGQIVHLTEEIGSPKAVVIKFPHVRGDNCAVVRRTSALPRQSENCEAKANAIVSVYQAGPATSLAVLFAAMVTMKELLIVDHNHNGYQVQVTGITMEDGSGFSWSIHTQYGSTIHIRTI